MLVREKTFNHYKQRLSKEKATDTIRFNVIEYVCSFPKIDPYEMAVALMKDGEEIVFDDTSIPCRENKRKKDRVFLRLNGVTK